MSWILKSSRVDRKRIWRGLLLVAAFALIGQQGFRSVWSRASQEPASAEKVAAGRRVFAGSCGMAYCHGTDGVGGTAPRLRNRDYSNDRLTRLIRDGIPGTAMPAFGKGLSSEQIAQLVAFLLSVNREVPSERSSDRVDPHFGGGGAVSGGQPVAAPAVAAPAASTSTSTTAASTTGASTTAIATGLTGDWQAGEEIFFDPANLSNCRICHTLHGRGGKVASDLSRLSGEPPATILRRILAPAPAADGRYARITLRLKSGVSVTGIQRDEDEKTLRIFDTSTMPPVSRHYLRQEIAGVDRHATAGCPGGYGARFTLQQLLDLIALIKTSDPAHPFKVGADDLLK